MPAFSLKRHIQALRKHADGVYALIKVRKLHVSSELINLYAVQLIGLGFSKTFYANAECLSGDCTSPIGTKRA